ncbi:MAG: glycosyltransferase family 2 protein [Lachnospiraceae bacterium]|nr:glycosyltransferase family 2 protein [Lachnospiraceae bacterium]
MKISVITTFYDGNKYMPAYQEMMVANEQKITEANQKSGSDYSMEVIIINDSPKIHVTLQALNASKKNWIVHSNERNLGIHGSRVEGLKIATGDYIVFLDQDDVLREDALLTFLQMASANEMKVIVSNCNFETKSGVNLLYRTDYQKQRVGSFDVYLCVGTQIVSPGQCAIPRIIIPDVWKENILKHNGADDYFLWLLLLGMGIGFSYVDMPLYTHVYTGENISETTAQTDRSVYEFIPYLRSSGFLQKEDVDLLERMMHYKAEFRKGNLVKKGILSLKNIDIFINNFIFKKKSKTPYGFNR